VLFGAHDSYPLERTGPNLIHHKSPFLYHLFILYFSVIIIVISLGLSFFCIFQVSACERYNPATESWESISPLAGFRTQHAGASWSNKAEGVHWLIVSGGLDRDVVLTSVRRYDATTDTWAPAPLAPMLTPRADHVMLNINDNLYVCGGWFEDGDTGNRCVTF